MKLYKTTYKNIDLSPKGIITILIITVCVGLFIFLAFPKILHSINNPQYSPNMKFTYYYLYENGQKNIGPSAGFYQEVYNRGVGKQTLFIENTGNINLYIDCLNRKGDLTIYIIGKDSPNQKLFTLQIPQKTSVNKHFNLKLDKQRKYLLILDHKYTYGGLYISWNKSKF